MGYGRRRGVSTFIAVLLLMALAVAAGVVIYSYTMGYLGGMGGTSTPGTISLDTASAVGSTNTVTAYVRNIGKSSVDFANGYVDGNNATTFSVNPDPLPVDSVATVTIGYTMTAGTTYEVKIVCTDNTQLSFSVKAK